MFERFAASARTAVEDARFEAERRGDRRIGTEHLLFAVLQDEKLAQLVGVDAVTAHEAAEQLDRAALVAVGLAFGESAPKGSTALGRRTPFTTGAKAVLGGALAHAAAEKARTITSRHLMLALLDRPEPDPVATLISTLPVDRAVLSERLNA
ncbi:MAG: Clp protease [Subtercola sp.]|nr:Clp protease [Subtercola sp.]